MVDHLCPGETDGVGWGETKHGKSTECKTRKEVIEDIETDHRPDCEVIVIGPQTQPQCGTRL